MATAQKNQIQIKLVKSMIGRPEKQTKVLKALGLYKTNQVVKHDLSDTIRGMIRKVVHLVELEEV